jgi:uncharacterized protein YndB with AHSA1/START domain
MAMNKYGEVLEDGSMKFVRLMPAPIERVWSWLVDGEKRARWLGGGSDISHAGQTVRFEFQHQNLTPHDEAYPEKYKAMEQGVAYDVDIKTCDAPTRLVMVWRDGQDSEIDIRLSEEGGETRLELVQRGGVSAEQFLGALGGWHAHLDIMVDKLGGETPKPFWKTHEALVEEYRDRAKEHLATMG